MNNFLNLQSDINYLSAVRPYYTGTWEHIAAATSYLVPFQIAATAISSDIPTVYTVDENGSETDITDHFLSSNQITSWDDTWQSGSFSATGALINNWSGHVEGDYIFSNEFTLEAGDCMLLRVNFTGFGLAIYEGAVQIKNTWADEFLYYLSEDGGTYTVRIVALLGAPNISSTTPEVLISRICLSASSDYWWYNGKQLYDTIADVFFLKIVEGSNYFYSDWISVCGFDYKLKFKVSSNEDFGGIKYDEGYAQWIYKDATVTRSPRADIEITGDSLNGEIVKEKTVSAVRYVLRMRVTELEYEAFVHAIGGDIEVTDRNGKVYDCQSVEIVDPTWYRSNGLLEISFIDGNNVNVWSKNNSSL